jgi:hypothetical protein
VLNVASAIADFAGDENKGARRERLVHDKHGFQIAMLLIGGFLALVAIPVVRNNDLTGSKDLAAIFSGWIVAIVGFYFIQDQAKEVVTAAKTEVTAAKAEGDAKTAMKRSDAEQALAGAEAALANFQQEAEAAVEILKAENAKLRAIAKEALEHKG